MNTKLAIQTLTEALDLAMKKGCYGIIENKNIITALDFIIEELNKGKQ